MQQQAIQIKTDEDVRDSAVLRLTGSHGHEVEGSRGQDPSTGGSSRVLKHVVFNPNLLNTHSLSHIDSFINTKE